MCGMVGDKERGFRDRSVCSASPSHRFTNPRCSRCGEDWSRSAAGFERREQVLLPLPSIPSIVTNNSSPPYPCNRDCAAVQGCGNDSAIKSCRTDGFEIVYCRNTAPYNSLPLKAARWRASSFPSMPDSVPTAPMFRTIHPSKCQSFTGREMLRPFTVRNHPALFYIDTQVAARYRKRSAPRSRCR